jgi:hypothetical protein
MLRMPSKDCQAGKGYLKGTPLSKPVQTGAKREAVGRFVGCISDIIEIKGVSAKYW